MRKRTLGVALLAGLAISGGSAFTAANDVDAIDNNQNNLAGFGVAAVSGATVEAVTYQHSGSDDLSSVTFYATGSMIDAEATVELSDGVPAVLATEVCTAAVGHGVTSAGGITLSATTTEFTCPVAPTVSVEDFETVGITVTR